MRGLVAVQGRVRCFLARRELKSLKIQAKSVEHQRQLNKGLENKIISMQQKLSELVSSIVTVVLRCSGMMYNFIIMQLKLYDFVSNIPVFR